MSPRNSTDQTNFRRQQLREIVRLQTQIYDMEQRGDFPQRFYLTCRCVVWISPEQGLGRNATRGLQSESHQSRASAHLAWLGSEAVERAAGIR